MGITDVLSKLIAYRLLEPVFQMGAPVQLTCREGTAKELLAELALTVWSWCCRTVRSTRRFACGRSITCWGVRAGDFRRGPLARKFRRGFPGSLRDAPFLLPTSNTALRQSLDRWFSDESLRPVVQGEFEDGADPGVRPGRPRPVRCPVDCRARGTAAVPRATGGPRRIGSLPVLRDFHRTDAEAPGNQSDLRRRAGPPVRLRPCPPATTLWRPAAHPYNRHGSGRHPHGGAIGSSLVVGDRREKTMSPDTKLQSSRFEFKYLIDEPTAADIRRFSCITSSRTSTRWGARASATRCTACIWTAPISSPAAPRCTEKKTASSSRAVLRRPPGQSGLPGDQAPCQPGHHETAPMVRAAASRGCWPANGWNTTTWSATICGTVTRCTRSVRSATRSMHERRLHVLSAEGYGRPSNVYRVTFDRDLRGSLWGQSEHRRLAALGAAEIGGIVLELNLPTVFRSG